MQDIEFRDARLEDLNLLYQFEQNIISEERPYDKTLKDGHINYYDLKELIQSDTVRVIVGVVGNEIISSAYAKIMEAENFFKHKSYIYLGFIFVKEHYRGKSITRKMIEELKTWAKSKEITELRLEVYNDNLSAIRAYEKAGLKKNLVQMRADIE